MGAQDGVAAWPSDCRGRSYRWWPGRRALDGADRQQLHARRHPPRPAKTRGASCDFGPRSVRPLHGPRTELKPKARGAERSDTVRHRPTLSDTAGAGCTDPRRSAYSARHTAHGPSDTSGRARHPRQQARHPPGFFARAAREGGREGRGERGGGGEGERGERGGGCVQVKGRVAPESTCRA